VEACVVQVVVLNNTCTLVCTNTSGTWYK